MIADPFEDAEYHTTSIDPGLPPNLRALQEEQERRRREGGGEGGNSRVWTRPPHPRIARYGNGSSNGSHANYNSFAARPPAPPSTSPTRMQTQSHQSSTVPVSVPAQSSTLLGVKRKFEGVEIFRTDRKIPIKQSPEFIVRPTANITRDDWKSFKDIKLELASELPLNHFCDESINKSLLKAKTQLASLNPVDLAQARQISNPYEKVGSSIFMNRAAVKLANLDAIYNLSASFKNNLNFVDLCGGPGGFSEYLFWKSEKLSLESCSGWGMTLKGNQDFNFNSINTSKKGSYQFHACYGADGTGDLYLPENMDSFCAQVLKDDKPVDFVVADGGFSVKGDEEHQEEQVKQLLTCQVLAMFKLLKKGGNFVIKVFDLLTDFSAEIVYLLPANSERYIICLNLQERSPQDLVNFLKMISLEFQNLKPSTKPAKSAHVIHQPGYMSKSEKIESQLLDITHILKNDFIVKDKEFTNSFEDSNIGLSMKQKKALDDLFQYATNPKLPKWNQEEIAGQLFTEWKLSPGRG